MHSKIIKIALASTISMLIVPSAFSETERIGKAQVFGEPYRTAPPAAGDQAQVIYFRPVSKASKVSGANIYIDEHFHTSLLPGGFTKFCLPPGPHLIGAYQNDAPLYYGKTKELYRVNLDAGKSYFVKVSEDGTGLPLSVEREEAEQALRSAHEQIHVVSRAGLPSCKSKL